MFRMHLLYVGIRLISMMTDLYVLYYAKGLNIQEEEEQEQPDDETKRNDESSEVVVRAASLSDPHSLNEEVVMAAWPKTVAESWPEGEK